MSLWTRLGSLAKADAHGVVDALEEPALVLRQQLREAKAALDAKRDRLDSLQADIDGLLDEDGRLERRIAELDEDVELALQSEKEDLARYAIKRLVPMRRRRDQIACLVENWREERAALEDVVAQQQDELTSLEQRVKSRLSQLERGESSRAGWHEEPVTDEEVELELLRRRAPADDRQQLGGDA